MRILTVIGGAVALLALLGIAGYLALGPERIWRLAGPPDLGEVAFETLERRSTPNDALACPPGICAAASDLAPPVFAMGARELRMAFRAAIGSEPLLERVAEDEAALSERYVQRSRWMRFPDTVVVRFYDLGEGRSTLALYGRSQIGHGDWGVNRARIERWLEKLGRDAQAHSTNPG